MQNSLKIKTKTYLTQGCADDETLEKFPPTIVWENEFDMFLTEATRLANRLRRLGRLLELRVQPGIFIGCLGRGLEKV